MEFTLDTVNVEYRGVELVQYRNYRDRNRRVLRFYFYTDLFASMGILSRLKSVPGFMDFLKGHIHTAIIGLSDEDFDQVKMHINNCNTVSYYARNGGSPRHNIMKLKYTNSYKFEDRPVIAYEDSLDGWRYPVETREDLIRAMLRMTSQSISK